MRSFLIAWIVSRPRVGSMWTYNVVRHLVAEAGCVVTPSFALHRDSEIIAEAERALEGTDLGRRCVLKTHMVIDPATPDCLFIVPHRDPRDALVSLMRFHRNTFAEALDAQVEHNRFSGHYRGHPAALYLPYLEIRDRPNEAVARISAFLDVVLPPGRAEEIADGLSRERVRDTIAAAEAAARSGKAERVEIVRRPDSTPRVLDLMTGFQSGHVSDYRDGDWRQILTPEQQVEVERRLGPWLAANGYH